MASANTQGLTSGVVTSDYGKTVEYRVVITEKNHYVASVEGSIVTITAPEGYKKRDVEAVIRNRFLHFYYMTHDEEYVKYHGKSTVHCLGKIYYARVRKANKDGVVIKDDTLTLYCKNNTLSQRKAIYKRFLKRVVERELCNLIHDAEYDFREITLPKIEVRPMSGLLGLNKGNVIYISPAIGRQAPIYIKTLLYHELCHCVIRNHEKEFYDFLNTKLQNGSELNKELVERQYFDAF